MIQDAILLKDGEILGWGGIKIWTEAMMALNPDCTNFVKARIFKTLVERAIDYCRRNKFGRLHVSPNTPEFHEILKKLKFMEHLNQSWPWRSKDE